MHVCFKELFDRQSLFLRGVNGRSLHSKVITEDLRADFLDAHHVFRFPEGRGSKDRAVDGDRLGVFDNDPEAGGASQVRRRTRARSRVFANRDGIASEHEVGSLNDEAGDGEAMDLLGRLRPCQTSARESRSPENNVLIRLL